MCPGVDFLQLPDTYLGVNLGGLQFFVTEQLLNKTDVRAAFEHVYGTCVPEKVCNCRPAQCLPGGCIWRICG